MLATHQVRAIECMRSLEATGDVRDANGRTVSTRVGWFADPPGAGKTRVIIAVATGAPPIEKVIAYSTSAGDLASSTMHGLPPSGTELATTVVVVPPSIVAQWEAELVQAGVTYLAVRLAAHVAALRVRIENTDMPCVTLVCSTRYAEVCDALAGHVPHRLVLDEAPRLKHMSRRIAARFQWLVSATTEVPDICDLLPRGSRAYWGALHILPQCSLNALVVRNADAAIVYPCQPTHVEHVCIGDAAMLLAPRQYVGPAVRAMLDANDVQGALAELGGGASEDLMTVVRRRIASDTEETSLVARQLEIQLTRLTGQARERAVAHIARVNDRLERLRRDSVSADARFANALLSDCAICYSPLEYPVLVPCCQNLFCTTCMLAWLRERPGAACPACRAPNVRLIRIATPAPEAAEAVEAGEAGEAVEAVEAVAARPELKSKAATVLEIVTAARAGVLIYSTHVGGMYTIRNKLDEAGVSHSELQGRSTMRDKALRSFRAGSVKVLFLSASENCAGIDLPGVSDIILYHQMPESTHTQIVGRGRRISRTEPLAVHSLVLAEDMWRA
jgi:hypothetical protein